MEIAHDDFSITTDHNTARIEWRVHGKLTYDFSLIVRTKLNVKKRRKYKLGSN